MKNRVNSLWTPLQGGRLSRLTFMKSCVALTAILGLPPTMLRYRCKAAETTELPTVIRWLHGLECTGCSESFIRSSSPFTSDVILNMISLEYDDTLAAASGEPLEEHLKKSLLRKNGKYPLLLKVGGSTWMKMVSNSYSRWPYI